MVEVVVVSNVLPKDEGAAFLEGMHPVVYRSRVTEGGNSLLGYLSGPYYG